MNKSSTGKQPLIDAIAGTVMRWQDATQKYDEAVGELYELNAAERHCLSFLWPGPQPPSAIARAVALTPAAVTALVDRLQARGYVTRSPDPNDRRKVQVSVTKKTMKLTADVYLPLAAKGEALLARYTEAELSAIARFATEALAVQEEATAKLRARIRS